jgi:uncharacterized protein (TIGR02996 family)
VNEDKRVGDERASLVAAIRANPGADEPRLRAAQWFEARGDEASAARAEFIRVQVERARRPGTDPEQPALMARERRLLARWARVWASAHPSLTKVIYRRGFVEYAHMSLRRFLPHRRGLFALEPVRDVRITGLYRPDVALLRQVARCDEWRSVEALRFHHQGPHHEPREPLLDLLESPSLSRVRALHCTRFALSAEGRRRFERLPLLERVEHLSLGDLDVFPDNPGAWFSDGWEMTSRWTQLRSLALPYSYAATPLRPWSDTTFWPHLHTLRVQGADDLGEVADRLPSSLSRVTLSLGARAQALFDALSERPLCELALSAQGSGAELHEAARRALSNTRRWSLRRLTVPALAKRGAEAIAESEAAMHVQHLTVERASRGALAALEGCRSLRSLSMGASQLEPRELLSFLKSPAAQGLVEIELQGVGLTMDLARAYEALPHLAVIRRAQEDEDELAAYERLAAQPDRWWIGAPPIPEPESEEQWRAFARTQWQQRTPDTNPPLDGHVPWLE